MRFWEGHYSVVDLSQVTAIAYVGGTGDYSIYKIALINGSTIEVEGDGLIDAYKEYHKIKE